MTATPPQGIDQDEVEAAIREELVRSGMPGRPNGLAHVIADRILALVRPVEGVTANLSESASEGDRRARVGHNHVTRDIKPEGQCPACDAYHLATRAQEARSAAVEDGAY